MVSNLSEAFDGAGEEAVVKNAFLLQSLLAAIEVDIKLKNNVLVRYLIQAKILSFVCCMGDIFSRKEKKKREEQKKKTIQNNNVFH